SRQSASLSDSSPTPSRRTTSSPAISFLSRTQDQSRTSILLLPGPPHLGLGFSFSHAFPAFQCLPPSPLLRASIPEFSPFRPLRLPHPVWWPARCCGTTSSL